MSGLGPEIELDLSLIEIHVRVDVTLELLIYATAAIVVMSEKAERGEDVLAHASAALEHIHRRIRGLAVDDPEPES